MSHRERFVPALSYLLKGKKWENRKQIDNVASLYSQYRVARLLPRMNILAHCLLLFRGGSSSMSSVLITGPTSRSDSRSSTLILTSAFDTGIVATGGVGHQYH